jgi:hypothetical protein
MSPTARSSASAAPAGFVAEQTIDATGCVVCPGLIDLGARLNSIEAELAAAVAGGVTSVVVPPDADPVLDEPELADRLVHRGQEIGKARVLPLGALTLGLKGERLAELAGLKKAGCVAFSQANKTVVDTEACCAPWNTPPPSASPSGCSRRTTGWRATASPTKARWPAASAWPASRSPPKPSPSPPSSSWSATPAAACT